MRKVLEHSVFSLLFFGFLLTAVVLQFYLHARNTQIEVELQNSLKKAEMIERKVSEFVVTSQLVSQFIVEDLEGIQELPPPEIEKKLRRYLKSSPPDLIHGIGIWFEPYQFRNNRKYFGPYARRKGLESEITYEWNIESYDYPSQNWYRAGLKADKSSAFTDPYLDFGLVYVTNSRAFFDKKNKILGIISVDLVMPQLQELIRGFNTDKESLLYIEDQRGRLLAHPQKDAFLEHVQMNSKDHQKRELLDYTSEDVARFLKLNFAPQFRREIQNENFGWKIVVDVTESYVLSKLKNIQLALGFGMLIFWSLTFYILKIFSDRKRENKENETRMELARAQLTQNAKMAALGEMAGSVAHEINNPLAIISGHAQMIKNEVTKENKDLQKIHTQADRVLQTVDRIGSIIRGLRSFARSGENDPFLIEYLPELITDTLSFCSERIRLLNVRLEIADIPKVSIKCRKSQLSQVLINLLSNSSDAVLELTEKWIRLDFEVNDSSQLRIYITDSGLGIDDSIIEKMMSPFFTTKEVGKGTGLGLSISKGIIEDHGGSLTYIKDYPHTRFCIELKLEALS